MMFRFLFRCREPRKGAKTERCLMIQVEFQADGRMKRERATQQDVCSDKRIRTRILDIWTYLWSHWISLTCKRRRWRRDEKDWSDTVTEGRGAVDTLKPPSFTGRSSEREQHLFEDTTETFSVCDYTIYQYVCVGVCVCLVHIQDGVLLHSGTPPPPSSTNGCIRHFCTLA